MKAKFAKLIELKSIVTMALVGCTCYLAIRSSFHIAPEFFASIVTAVITYYFTRKSAEVKAVEQIEHTNTDVIDFDIGNEVE